MRRLLTTRRSEWLPGLAMLDTAILVGGLLGFSLESRSWPVYIGLMVLVLFGIGGLERFISRRKARATAPRVRGRLRVIPGGKNAPYDLESDERTNGQRYLM